MGSSFKSFHSRGGMSCLAKHVFLNGPSPASFSFIFGLFNKQYITIFTANQCEKSQSSIRRRDSNPRPLEHESSPITTRQGRLSGKICLLCLRKGKDMWQVGRQVGSPVYLKSATMLPSSALASVSCNHVTWSNLTLARPWRPNNNK